MAPNGEPSPRAELHGKLDAKSDKSPCVRPDEIPQGTPDEISQGTPHHEPDLRLDDNGVGNGGSDEEDETQSISNQAEPFDAFKIRVHALIRKTWPGAAYITVERLKSGEFNRINGVTCDIGQKVRYIIRLPWYLFPGIDFGNQVTALRFLEIYTNTPAPHIVVYNTTKEIRWVRRIWYRNGSPDWISTHLCMITRVNMTTAGSPITPGRSSLLS